MNTIPFVPGASFTHQNPLIVPVLSTKGGKGKSTQSANLADFLADAGKKTLLIDGDHSQSTASSNYPYL